jgi:hypothetical protein
MNRKVIVVSALVVVVAGAFFAINPFESRVACEGKCNVLLTVYEKPLGYSIDTIAEVLFTDTLGEIRSETSIHYREIGLPAHLIDRYVREHNNRTEVKDCVEPKCNCEVDENQQPASETVEVIHEVDSVVRTGPNSKTRYRYYVYVDATRFEFNGKCKETKGKVDVRKLKRKVGRE